MKKRYLGIFFIAFFCFTLSTFALSKEQKGIILESFKKIQYDVIFDNDTIFFDEEDRSVFDISRRLNAFNTVLEKVQDKKKYLEDQNDTIAKRIVSLEQSIAEMDNDIQDIVQQTQKTNDEIVYTKDLIEKNQEAITLLAKKIEENREVLLEYMVHIYKKSGEIYSQEDIDNLKTILMNGEDISIVLDDLYFKGLIETAGQKLIDQHRGYISQLYIKKVDLDDQENSLKSLRKSLVVEKKMLEEKKDAKKRLLEISKGTESIYKKYIEEKVELERNVRLQQLEERIRLKNQQKKVLDEYGCSYIDLSKKTIFSEKLQGKCLELNKVLYAESLLKSLEPDTGTENIFDWPITPYYGISAFYNDLDYKKEFSASHSAIDIVTPQGTSIRAPADGYVIHISPPISSDYAFIALKHANGYVTVYGHINEVLVNDLDYVEKGEIFAKSGGEYGTKGAGILTTGPHLHFELYKDREYVDPLEYMDISLLPYSSLPEKYRYKYLADFKFRKGFEYELLKKEEGKSIFKLEGNTEIERQQSLLSKYAAPAFKDWNMWIEEALDGKIDPTFIMCIGLAESSLGNRLKTRYNIGNVGNTDSGGTWDFPNARTGISWIVRTLNNKILGKYTQIQQLSRYGNKDGAIYASSPDHWHNNVTKCMSHIKQKYIPDDYNFRLE